MTAEELIELAGKFGRACSCVYGIAPDGFRVAGDLESAIRSLVEERELLLKENVAYFSKIAAMRNSVTVVCAEFPNVAEYVGQLELQRDSLLDENAKMKAAILAHWKEDDSWCAFCGDGDADDEVATHSDYCIVRELEAN